MRDPKMMVLPNIGYDESRKERYITMIFPRRRNKAGVTCLPNGTEVRIYEDASIMVIEGTADRIADDMERELKAMRVPHDYGVHSELYGTHYLSLDYDSLFHLYKPRIFSACEKAGFPEITEWAFKKGCDQALDKLEALDGSATSKQPRSRS